MSMETAPIATSRRTAQYLVQGRAAQRLAERVILAQPLSDQVRDIQFLPQHIHKPLGLQFRDEASWPRRPGSSSPVMASMVLLLFCPSPTRERPLRSSFTRGAP